MQVIFRTDDFGDEAASFEAVASGKTPAEAYHLWGQVILREDGQPDVVIADDLSTLGYTLSVQAMEALTTKNRAELRLVGWPGTFLLEGDTETIRVTGSRGEDARYPRAELLSAIRACGGRIADFLRELSLLAPQFAYSARGLKAALDR